MNGQLQKGNENRVDLEKQLKEKKEEIEKLEKQVKEDELSLDEILKSYKKLVQDYYIAEENDLANRFKKISLEGKKFHEQVRLFKEKMDADKTEVEVYFKKSKKEADELFQDMLIYQKDLFDVAKKALNIMKMSAEETKKYAEGLKQMREQLDQMINKVESDE